MSREPGLVTVLPNEGIYFKAVIHMLLMCRLNTVSTNTEHVLFCVCDSESFLETSFSVVRGFECPGLYVRVGVQALNSTAT